MKIQTLVDVFSSVKSSADVVKYINDKFFTDNDINELLFITERILRDLLYLKADLEDNVASTAFKGAYADLLDELDENAIAAMMEEVNIAERKIAANCNNINVVDCLLLKLAEEKAKCKK